MRKPTPKANETIVANALNRLKRQGVGHFAERPSIVLWPFAADDAVVFGNGVLIRCHWHSRPPVKCGPRVFFQIGPHFVIWGITSLGTSQALSASDIGSPKDRFAAI